MAEPDILDFVMTLTGSKSYTPKERYHDFRRVFMETDEGRRVLREILSWGKLFQPGLMGNPIDPYLMAVHKGEQNMALRLLATVYNEPPERATQTLSKKGVPR